MQLSPYRRSSMALPSKLASCADDMVCRCNLARPRVLFAHRGWRWVWLAVSAFGGSAITMIAVATMMMPTAITARERPRVHAVARRASTSSDPVASPWRTASTFHATSMFGGATHDPEVLLAQARAARDAGLDVSVIESRVFFDASEDARDRIDLRSSDVVVSVDGYTPGTPRLIDVRQAGSGTIVLELLRGGRRVVMALRRGE